MTIEDLFAWLKTQVAWVISLYFQEVSDQAAIKDGEKG